METFNKCLLVCTIDSKNHDSLRAFADLLSQNPLADCSVEHYTRVFDND